MRKQVERVARTKRSHVNFLLVWNQSFWKLEHRALAKSSGEAARRESEPALIFANFHFRSGNRRENKPNNFHNNMLYVVDSVLPQKNRQCERANAFMLFRCPLDHTPFVILFLWYGVIELVPKRLGANRTGRIVFGASCPDTVPAVLF